MNVDDPLNEHPSSSYQAATNDEVTNEKANGSSKGQIQKRGKTEFDIDRFIVPH